MERESLTGQDHRMETSTKEGETGILKGGQDVGNRGPWEHGPVHGRLE